MSGRFLITSLSGSTPLPLRKILKCHLISWCENFVETNSCHRVLGETLETRPKIAGNSVRFHKTSPPGIRWNYGNLYYVLQESVGLLSRSDKKINEKYSLRVEN